MPTEETSAPVEALPAEVAAPKAETAAPAADAVVVETTPAPTIEDFNKLTLKQQEEVMREREKLAEGGKKNRALFPDESKRHKPNRQPVAPVVAKVEPKAEEKPAPEAETPEAEEVAEEKPVVAEKPKADAEDEDSEGEKKTPQMRVRPKTQRDRDIVALMNAGRSAEEAIAMLGGSPKPAEPLKDEPPIEKAFDEQISAIEAEIIALEKEQDAAAQEADVAKALKLARQITAKERAIETKQAAKEYAISQQKETVAQTAAQKEAAIESEDHAAVVEDYPEIGDKSSPERKKFEDFIREKKQDPRYDGKFASLYWRSTLAHEFAAKNGMKPASLRTAFEPPKTATPAAKLATAAKPASAPPAVKAASQATAAKTLTTKDAPSDQTFEITQDEAIKQFDNLTKKQQQEVMLELEKIRKAQGKATSNRAA